MINERYSGMQRQPRETKITLRPSYLVHTFQELGRGFFLAGPLPEDVSISANDAWFDLALALERAKAADFSYLRRICEWLAMMPTSLEFWSCATKLLGHSAPVSLLRELARTLELGSGRFSAEIDASISEVLVRAMQLWSVPELLSAYVAHCSAGRAKWAEPIIFWLSALLEPTLGRIAMAEEQPLDAYRMYVLETYNRILTSLGTDKLPVWHGKLFGVREMTLDLLRRLRDPATDFEGVDDRLWFEASTGIDCSSFFVDGGDFQPLAAAAIVEEFLDSGEAEKYEPGVRYFFGHRIPD